MIVRRETPADVEAARAVQVAAFRRPELTDEPIEARLLDDLRKCDGWIPELSIVVERDGEVIGHAVTTRGFVGEVPVVALGPIGVLPAHQRGGVGHALVHATLGAADAMGEPLLALLGSPLYYGRYGFVASHHFGIVPPNPAWGDAFQVRTLATHRADITGEFRYAGPFDTM